MYAFVYAYIYIYYIYIYVYVCIYIINIGKMSAELQKQQMCAFTTRSTSITTYSKKMFLFILVLR